MAPRASDTHSNAHAPSTPAGVVAGAPAAAASGAGRCTRHAYVPAHASATAARPCRLSASDSATSAGGKIAAEVTSSGSASDAGSVAPVSSSLRNAASRDDSAAVRRATFARSAILLASPLAAIGVPVLPAPLPFAPARGTPALSSEARAEVDVVGTRPPMPGLLRRRLTSTARCGAGAASWMPPQPRWRLAGCSAKLDATAAVANDVLVTSGGRLLAPMRLPPAAAAAATPRNRATSSCSCMTRRACARSSATWLPPAPPPPPAPLDIRPPAPPAPPTASGGARMDSLEMAAVRMCFTDSQYLSVDTVSA